MVVGIIFNGHGQSVTIVLISCVCAGLGGGGAPLECGMEALELWEGCFTMCETVTRMLGDTLECLGETLECRGRPRWMKKVGNG